MPTTRRDFLRVTATGGAALVLGIGRARGDDDAKTPWKPNAWLRVDPDGSVVAIIGKQEMGQGVRTSLAQILADELDADWSKVRIEQASTGPDYKSLGTGGSGSIEVMWRTLRPAAATARWMLALAAANQWNVDLGAVRTENGFAIHEGKRLSYGSLAAAASKLEVPKDVALKSPRDLKLIGKRIRKIDDPSIVTGKAKYGLDARVPGMKFASVLRCPVVGGSVKKFDATKATGVRVIPITAGVAIVADNTWSAMQARKLVTVEWDEGPNREFDSKRYLDSLLAAASQPGQAMRVEGDVASAFGSAAKTLEANYVYPFYAHAPIEPMNAVAHFKDGKCDVWAPTQSPNSAQSSVSKLLGIKPEEVTVHPTLIGGGFGRRLRNDFIDEAAEISKAIGAPVQVVWTREEDFVDGFFQHATVESMRGALDSSGNAIGWSHKKITRAFQSGRDPRPEDWKDPAKLFIDRSWGVYEFPYAFPNLETRFVHVDTPLRYGPWRAVYAPSSVFARESFLDELAHAAGRDPLQYRLDLLTGPDTFKTFEVTVDRTRARRVLETLKERAQWKGGRPGTGRGRGIAYDTFHGDAHIAYVADVTAKGDKWKVDRIVCVVDAGIVVNPTGIEQQIEGGVVWALSQLTSELTIRNGRVEQTSYAEFPIPAIADVPPVEVHILPTVNNEPFGIGEPPVPPVVPAVLNAVFAATGNRIRQLPV